MGAAGEPAEACAVDLDVWLRPVAAQPQTADARSDYKCRSLRSGCQWEGQLDAGLSLTQLCQQRGQAAGWQLWLGCQAQVQVQLRSCQGCSPAQRVADSGCSDQQLQPVCVRPKRLAPCSQQALSLCCFGGEGLELGLPVRPGSRTAWLRTRTQTLSGSSVGRIVCQSGAARTSCSRYGSQISSTTASWLHGGMESYPTGHRSALLTPCKINRCLASSSKPNRDATVLGAQRLSTAPARLGGLAP